MVTATSEAGFSLQASYSFESLSPGKRQCLQDFAINVDSTALETCISQIKIIHESINDGRDDDFEKAKHLLSDAERIYFVGFGFHATNVKRLGIDSLHVTGKTIEATGYNLTQRERDGLTELRRILSGKGPMVMSLQRRVY